MSLGKRRSNKEKGERERERGGRERGRKEHDKKTTTLLVTLLLCSFERKIVRLKLQGASHSYGFTVRGGTYTPTTIKKKHKKTIIHKIHTHTNISHIVHTTNGYMQTVTPHVYVHRHMLYDIIQSFTV